MYRLASSDAVGAGMGVCDNCLEGIVECDLSGVGCVVSKGCIDVDVCGLVDSEVRLVANAWARSFPGIPVWPPIQNMSILEDFCKC